MEHEGRSAREELWRRFDAGAITAEELDARLRLVDRAAADPDPAALRHALDGPVPRARRRSTQRGAIAAAALVALVIAALGIRWALGGDNGDGDRDGDGVTAGGSSETTPPVPMPLPPPPAVPGGAPDCPELDDALAAFEAIDADEPAANPALLSEPPALPEGYTVSDEDPITPGTDPNIAMSVNAGTPPPEEILGRDVVGDLLVTMRTYRYSSAADAEAAARNVLQQAICSYTPEGFDVPGRPEITGSVVSGVIPTTAFAGFRLAERRYSVAVVAASDDETDIEAARQLAGTIAGLELDAARTPPPPG